MRGPALLSQPRAIEQLIGDALKCRDHDDRRAAARGIQDDARDASDAVRCREGRTAKLEHARAAKPLDVDRALDEASFRCGRHQAPGVGRQCRRGARVTCHDNNNRPRLSRPVRTTTGRANRHNRTFRTTPIILGWSGRRRNHPKVTDPLAPSRMLIAFEALHELRDRCREHELTSLVGSCRYKCSKRQQLLCGCVRFTTPAQ